MSEEIVAKNQSRQVQIFYPLEFGGRSGDGVGTGGVTAQEHGAGATEVPSRLGWEQKCGTVERSRATAEGDRRTDDLVASLFAIVVLSGCK